jgi:hypothetical protein
MTVKEATEKINALYEKLKAAEQRKVTHITVRKWCLKNGIKRELGRQGVMEYFLTDKDISRFMKRLPQGRPKATKPATKASQHTNQ